MSVAHGRALRQVLQVPKSKYLRRALWELHEDDRKARLEQGNAVNAEEDVLAVLTGRVQLEDQKARAGAASTAQTSGGGRSELAVRQVKLALLALRAWATSPGSSGDMPTARDAADAARGALSTEEGDGRGSSVFDSIFSFLDESIAANSVGKGLLKRVQLTLEFLLQAAGDADGHCSTATCKSKLGPCQRAAIHSFEVLLRRCDKGAGGKDSVARTAAAVDTRDEYKRHIRALQLYVLRLIKWMCSQEKNDEEDDESKQHLFLSDDDHVFLRCWSFSYLSSSILDVLRDAEKQKYEQLKAEGTPGISQRPTALQLEATDCLITISTTAAKAASASLGPQGSVSYEHKQDKERSTRVLVEELRPAHENAQEESNVALLERFWTQCQPWLGQVLDWLLKWNRGVSSIAVIGLEQITDLVITLQRYHEMAVNVIAMAETDADSDAPECPRDKRLSEIQDVLCSSWQYVGELLLTQRVMGVDEATRLTDQYFLALESSLSSIANEAQDGDHDSDDEDELETSMRSEQAAEQRHFGLQLHCLTCICLLWGRLPRELIAKMNASAKKGPTRGTMYVQVLQNTLTSAHGLGESSAGLSRPTSEDERGTKSGIKRAQAIHRLSSALLHHVLIRTNSDLGSSNGPLAMEAVHQLMESTEKDAASEAAAQLVAQLLVLATDKNDLTTQKQVLQSVFGMLDGNSDTEPARSGARRQNALGVLTHLFTLIEAEEGMEFEERYTPEDPIQLVTEEESQSREEAIMILKCQVCAHLLSNLEDEVLTARAAAAALFTRAPPTLFLPALSVALASPNAKERSAASVAFHHCLCYRARRSGMGCSATAAECLGVLLDSLSNLEEEHLVPSLSSLQSSAFCRTRDGVARMCSLAVDELIPKHLKQLSEDVMQKAKERSLGQLAQWTTTVEDWEWESVFEYLLKERLFSGLPNSLTIQMLSSLSKQLSKHAASTVLPILLDEMTIQVSNIRAQFQPGQQQGQDAVEQTLVFHVLSPLLVLKMLSLATFQDSSMKALFVSRDWSDNADTISSLVQALAFSEEFTGRDELDQVRRLAAELFGRFCPSIALAQLYAILHKSSATAQDLQQHLLASNEASDAGRNRRLSQLALISGQYVRSRAVLFSTCTFMRLHADYNEQTSLLDDILAVCTQILLTSPPAVECGDKRTLAALQRLDTDIHKAQMGCIDALAISVLAELDSLGPASTGHGQDTQPNEAHLDREVHSERKFLIEEIEGPELNKHQKQTSLSDRSARLVDILKLLTSESLDWSKIPWLRRSCRQDQVEKSTTLNLPVPFRLCMANVLIQVARISPSDDLRLRLLDLVYGELAAFAARSLVHRASLSSMRMGSAEYDLSLATDHDDIYAASLQVLLTFAFQLKNATVPHVEDMFSLACAILKHQGSAKVRLASGRLLASIFGGSQGTLDKIAPHLDEARRALASLASIDQDNEVRELCAGLLKCITGDVVW